MLLIEKEHLLPLACDEFQLAEVSFPRVDQAGCAKVLANSYSVPPKPGSIVAARAYSSLIEFRHDGARIAENQRSYGRAEQVLDLEHYPFETWVFQENRLAKRNPGSASTAFDATCGNLLNRERESDRSRLCS